MLLQCNVKLIFYTYKIQPSIISHINKKQEDGKGGKGEIYKLKIRISRK